MSLCNKQEGLQAGDYVLFELTYPEKGKYHNKYYVS